jgi:hypothetical protein
MTFPKKTGWACRICVQGQLGGPAPARRTNSRKELHETTEPAQELALRRMLQVNC